MPADAGPSKDRFRSQVSEVINRNAVVGLAPAQGYNVFLPVDDGGIDFLLCRETDSDIRKVQLKSRWSIDRKHVGRDIWVAFPIAGEWYLMPHDEMVAHAETKPWGSSASWKDHGGSSSGRPGKDTVAACQRHRFGFMAAISAKAAGDVEMTDEIE